MRKRSIESHGNRKWFEADIERLIEMRRSNMTLREISAVVGVTRARIWQLVGKRKFCRGCRAESAGDVAWRGPACPNCLREARRKACRNPECRETFVPVINRRTLYCPKCRWMSRSCFCGCGKVIVRPRRRYNTERLRWFHSHKVWGEWKRKMKYDWRKEKRAA